tara:strand:- start:21241 stop:21615 length:375 start_codon:yes stop_codon:yes gene_type:complete
MKSLLRGQYGMGDILEFPSQQAQGLAFLDRQLRELLTKKGADAQLVDFAAAQLTKMYAQLSASEQYSFTVNLPGHLNDEDRDSLYQQINTGLEGIRKENHALLVGMLAKLVLAQVKLFQHERPE